MRKLLLIFFFSTISFDAFSDTHSELPLGLVQEGRRLFAAHRCNACHTIDSEKSEIAPTLFKKFGTEVTVDEGKKIQFDENYIRDSILEPNKNIAKGFLKGRMPSFKDKMEEASINAVIEFIKQLK